MNQQEDEQYEIEQRIQDEEPSSPGKRALLGIGAVVFILFLPSILEAASGEKPWRF